jgi:hypothetical protein
VNPLLVAAAAVVVCGLVAAGAFWLLDLALGDMPHPLWGFAGGAALGLFSYLRTGWSDRRDGRGVR